MWAPSAGRDGGPAAATSPGPLPDGTSGTGTADDRTPGGAGSGITAGRVTGGDGLAPAGLLAGVGHADLATHLVHRLHDPQRRGVRQDRRLALTGDEASGELGCRVRESAHILRPAAGVLVEDLMAAAHEPDA